MAGPVTGADLAGVLAGARLLPVLTVPSTATADPLADALAAGGARCAEVTFRTPGAERVLKTMAAHGELAVGAGTVLTPEQAEGAVAAGARFVVSPGFDEDVVARCRELGVPVVPGIATATELMRALKAGLDTVKLSPPNPLAACVRCGRWRRRSRACVSCRPAGSTPPAWPAISPSRRSLRWAAAGWHPSPISTRATTRRSAA